MGEFDWLKVPIPVDRPSDLDVVLSNLQGHILSSHGRDLSVHIFLRFCREKPEKVEKAKKWIAKLAHKRITSAHKQLEEAQRYEDYKMSGDLFCCFYLSAEGYRTLGIPEANLPQDAAFRQGMTAEERRRLLHDPSTDQWEKEYHGRIDAMLLLADDDKQTLHREARRCLLEAQKVADICAVEHGIVMRNPHTQESIEHFGYVDGRSQPLFFQKDIKKQRDEKDGTETWKPEAGPSLVLVEDPNGDPEHKGAPAYGSYLVFRKLEQNVRCFQEHLDKLADALHLQGHDRRRAEALVMGRFRDGTPLMLQSTPGQHDPVPNDFDFKYDDMGGQCPFQAHIRRVNPRGERDSHIQITLTTKLQELLGVQDPVERDRLQSALTTKLQQLFGATDQGERDRIQSALVDELAKFAGVADGDERYRSIRSALAAKYAETYAEGSHRIARRSVPYGTRQPAPYDNPSLNQLPKEGVGLLFMCYQSDIRRQFEFLQANWANTVDFPLPGKGHDALIGRVSADQAAIKPTWPKRWGGRDSQDYSFPNFVILKGGEYFFAPSLSFLKSMK